MERKEKEINGTTHVAVLVSHGFGAGWYSWNRDLVKLVFDPRIVDLLERGDIKGIETYCEKEYPHTYLGGLDGLCIYWIPKGSKFRIKEYDGAEGLELLEDIDLLTA